MIKGVLEEGEHVVTSSLEHNSVMRPLIKEKIPFDTAYVSLNDDKATLYEFERKIRPNTRLVICTGASNVFGKILPIAEIGALCKERGVLFAVDAAQIAGVIPIDMKKMNIDYLCAAPHKGLYAPMGIGILICENSIKNTTEASREKTYIDSVIKRERQKAGLELDEEEEIKRGMGL